MIPRLRRPAPLLVLAAAAAALASCGGEAGVNTPAPGSSTPAPSVAPGALQPGSLLTGDTFTVRVPLDWSVKPNGRLSGLACGSPLKNTAFAS